MIGRIFVDFNHTTHDKLGDRVFVGKEGSWQIEQYRQLNWLQPGAVVKLSDGELEVKAILELTITEQGGWWYGRPDWSTRRDLDSPADGLEEYRGASADQKLIILRNETTALIDIVQAYAASLQKVIRNSEPNAGLLPFSQIVDGLAKTIQTLRDVFDKIVDPVEK